jgi:large subunit ribosomal protein L37e
MAKGTPSFGKKIGVKHIRCRRCGRVSFHVKKGRCAACGFGETKTMKSFNWNPRNYRRERKHQTGLRKGIQKLKGVRNPVNRPKSG